MHKITKSDSAQNSRSSAFSRPILPPELELEIIELTEWHQHPNLALVCKRFHAILSTTKFRKQRYTSIQWSKSTVLLRKSGEYDPPMIHKALVYHNFLKWNRKQESFANFHLDLKCKSVTTLKPHEVSSRTRNIGDEFDFEQFRNEPAFYSFKSGAPVVLSGLVPKYRYDNGDLRKDRALPIDQVSTVGEVIEAQRELCESQQDARHRMNERHMNWIFCTYVVGYGGRNMEGMDYITVSVEMDEDVPQKKRFAPGANYRPLEGMYGRNSPRVEFWDLLGQR